MSSLRFLLLFGALFVATGLSVLVGNAETFTGDLTRIGALPDAAFRPQQTITPIGTQWLINTPIHQADVIVIGDSFSLPLKWQGELVRAGLRVHTTHWSALQDGQVHPLTWLRKQGGRSDAVIVFQIVERFANGRISNLVVSSNQQTPAKAAVVTTGSEVASTGTTTSAASGVVSDRPTTGAGIAPPASSQTSRMSTGIRLIYNRIRLSKDRSFISRYPGSGDATVVRPFPDGCRYFTNIRCDRLLTLQQDETLPRFTESDRQALEETHQRLSQQHGGTVVWLIIPNKSTVYADTALTVEAAAGLDDGNSETGPNLFREWLERREQVKDLYMPDDSHLSDNGYRELGHLVYKRIQPKP